MHKKFEINGNKIKGGCQSGRKLVAHNSKSDLPLRIGNEAGGASKKEGLTKAKLRR